MGLPALVFIGIPAAFAAVDGGLRWILMIRDQHRAKKRVEETGEPEIPNDAKDVDDDILYAVGIDVVAPGRVLKRLHESEVWKDIIRGVERAQLDKQVEEFPCCESCGRFS